MKNFVKKALEKLDKLDTHQIKEILSNISGENELLETVLYSLEHGLIVTNKDHKILLANKASKRLFPFKHGNILDKEVWEVITDQEISFFLFDSLMKQEKISDHEITVGNGHVRTIACSLMPLVRDKKVQGNLIHIEDVTEKRTKEVRLRRAESLAALTTLTAGVAHEIKNPLGSIGIHIQLIQKQIKEKEMIETVEIKDALNVINEEVTRLNRVVLDFLFAVRPMDSKPEIKDLNVLITELLHFLKYELDEAHIELQVELGKIPFIEMDEKYIKQALLNVIQNAMSSMPDGGILIIKTGMEDERVFLEITDNGTGIPEEIKDKIFEPYFTTKDFGSGLGLTLVFKIIKDHMGEISVKSKEGMGTSFILYFPVPQKIRKLLEFSEKRSTE
ncbi:MAG: PAS domain-containing protein [Spirochaetales bacterium]|nr:PAS domain-containing protein [Spirochaetales bacterium]